MNTLVFDVGKTNVKLRVLDAEWKTVFSRETANTVVADPPYPHFDTERTWRWLLKSMREAADFFNISGISMTAHGAAAALINRNGPDSGLVLPILDYEYPGVAGCNAAYDSRRPGFSETFSPDLPLGLNLGRQLYWQQHEFPREFARVTDILFYPQYWAWRLCGERCSEITSLGCHTDLWNPREETFSSLVTRQEWGHLFPPLRPAWTELGLLHEEIAEETGLPRDCRVFAGVHDSNASFLRYRVERAGTPFTVVSTGTWSIVMASGASLAELDPDQDTLVNVDVTGEPVVCSRSMGGREFEIICQLTGTPPAESCSHELLQQIIDAEVMALPDFSRGSGPFPERPGRIIGKLPERSGVALATLYCALMLDYQMDLIQAPGDVFVEGAFLKNKLLCTLLSQLRERRHQKIWLSEDTAGTLQGCAQLAHWNERNRNLRLTSCTATRLHNLDHYRTEWRKLAESGITL